MSQLDKEDAPIMIQLDNLKLLMVQLSNQRIVPNIIIQ